MGKSSEENVLLRANLLIFMIFTHIYWLIYKYDNNSFLNKDLQYINFWSISAQTHVGGPTNMVTPLSIIVGIIQLGLVLFINIMELAHDNESGVIQFLSIGEK